MRKIDFSKKIVLAVLVWAVLCVTGSYILAYMGKDANTTITGNILLYVVAPTITAYMTTKTVEKTNRNKHGLDETGEPIKRIDGINGVG